MYKQVQMMASGNSKQQIRSVYETNEALTENRRALESQGTSYKQVKQYHHLQHINSPSRAKSAEKLRYYNIAYANPESQSTNEMNPLELTSFQLSKPPLGSRNSLIASNKSQDTAGGINKFRSRNNILVQSNNRRQIETTLNNNSKINTNGQPEIVSLSNLVAKGYSRQSTTNKAAGVTPLKSVVVKNSNQGL